MPAVLIQLNWTDGRTHTRKSHKHTHFIHIYFILQTRRAGGEIWKGANGSPMGGRRGGTELGAAELGSIYGDRCCVRPSFRGNAHST